MFSLLKFALIYLFGGLTLIPLLLGLAFVVLPHHRSPADRPPDPSDNEFGEKAGSHPLAKQFRRNHELDVAAGYFAVCREYVPGGQNGKPPERTTPAGEIIAEESPSVYQNIYRSLFDRKQGPSLDPGKTNGKAVKKANNVFYIVLRHHHLMLFDSIEQVVVRHVISLDHHDVSIYGGGNEIPEGELWIKRNAICLTRKASVGDVTSTSKPFYLFSENCMEKEDFYFGLLANQERQPGESVSPPRPQHFELKDIISLVQKLHSSEEHLQTRWINAFIGRIFLAIYRTRHMEDYVRLKITKKIARVKKPAFVSGIILQRIDMGQSAPYITNPRLKDLNVDGECCAEVDLKYNGSFRLEVAATARIDLGTRFKAREVNLVLAVVIKRLEGHALFRLKPPPSNRLWMTFEKMPNIEMHIEPIVSSRQITYSIILRAIESRIREVIAETIVLPHWDDSPFTDTVHQRFRGGIWRDGESKSETLPTEDKNISLGDDNDTKQSSQEVPQSPALPARDERSLSMPLLVDHPPSPGLSPGPKKRNVSSSPLVDCPNDGVEVATQKKPEMPKAIRTLSSASSSAATPILSTDNANTEATAAESRTKQHTSSATNAMFAISNRSRPTSPVISPIGSPPQLQGLHTAIEAGSFSTSSSSSEADILHDGPLKSQGTVTRNNFDIQAETIDSSCPSPKTISSSVSISNASNHESSTSKAFSTSQQPLNASDRGKTLAVIGATAVAAKKWGLSVLNRSEQNPREGESTKTKRSLLDQPMGRGQPIPFSSPSAIPKRKALLPPPLLPDRRRQASGSELRETTVPPLPRRHNQGTRDGDEAANNDGMLVVEAPPASEPSSPLSTNEEFIYQMKINSEGDEDEEESLSYDAATKSGSQDDETALPRRPRTRSSKTHVDDNEHHMPPTWTVAQEEGRAHSIWAEESSLP